MSLTVCRECQGQVSTQARACPHCGAPFPGRREWRGSGFEWKSKAVVYGYPFVHVAFGRNTKGKLRVAKGFIAIGQFALGVITIAQFGVGILFGFGQFLFGLTAIAQFAFTLIFGLGQFATGYVAVGQIVLAYYGLAQAGFARYMWSPENRDPIAFEFFRQIGTPFKTYLDAVISFIKHWLTLPKLIK